MSNLGDHISACTLQKCGICDTAQDHTDDCVNPWCSRCDEIHKAIQKRIDGERERRKGAGDAA